MEDDIAGTLPEGQHDFLSPIQNATDQLETLADELFDLARLDAGPVTRPLRHGGSGPLPEAPDTALNL